MNLLNLLQKVLELAITIFNEGITLLNEILRQFSQICAHE